MEFEIWIYRGLICLLLVVVWYVFKKFASGILNKFDIIIEKLGSLGISNTMHEQQIITLSKADEQFSKRFDDHAIRLRKVENKQSSCRVCKTETE